MFMQKKKRVSFLGNPEGWLSKLSDTKKAPESRAFSYTLLKNLFLPLIHVRFVTAHEFVHTAGGVHQFNFTSVERV